MNWSTFKQIGVIAALAVSAVILWIDIATGLWQDYVILAGLAAGLVTFVLTALIVDRVIARSTHERWAPVTRLAMSDILHALADDDLSEITRGKIVPRQFGSVLPDATVDIAREQISQIRHTVVEERQRLAALLTGWSTFLSSSADAADVLDHTAELAERLDRIRDAAVEAGDEAAATQIADLNHEMELFNTAVRSLVQELRRVIDSTDRVESRATNPA